MTRPFKEPLPIDPILPRIIEAVGAEGRVVLQAEPGAGKTTRVPPALLEIAGEGEVLVLEPRRIAARLAAVRVAKELGERVGETVGYQVRHENVGGPKTRLRFATEGILTRRLIDDPTLQGVSALVLDEFHERHLHADLALATATALRLGSRRDLKIVVMSATLEAAVVANHLGGAPVIEAEGRAHPVTIEHVERPDDRPVPERVAAAVRRVVREEERSLGSGAEDGGPEGTGNADTSKGGGARSGEGAGDVQEHRGVVSGEAKPMRGDILVFLPGAAEIRRVRDLLEPFSRERELDLVVLHGSLPASEQDRAVRPGSRRKVILATNVAETSITLPSVTCVIDSGLARLAAHSPWTGLPSLEVRSVARSSATQRAGRAGRLGPGRCLRLFTEHDLRGRPEHTPPEILRADLSELCLGLAASGITDPAALPWLDAPPAAALEAAGELLVRLGAIDEEGAITKVGKEMARLPVHPRQARLLVEASVRDVYSPACTIAALVGERDIVARASDLGGREARTTGPCDLLERRELLLEAGFGKAGASRMRRVGLDPGAVSAVARAAGQLRRLGPGRDAGRADSAQLSESREEALRLCVLAAWPDRVARRRRPGSATLVLAEGGEVRLAPSSVVREADWIVAVDATRRGKSVMVQLATEIEPDWLLDLFSERVEERFDVTWNAKARRVDVMSKMVFGDAVLMENRERAKDRPEAWRLLADQARRAGVEAFADRRLVETALGRIRVAAEVDPDAGYPVIDHESLEISACPSGTRDDGGNGERGVRVLDIALERLSEGKTRFDELTTTGFIEALFSLMPWRARARLDEVAPTHIPLPGRKRAPVHYPLGAKPYVASRIQDFFGLEETPRIGGGRLSLVVHLLAPNGRPVQITEDLSGFWERHYPTIRRELSRRYPRHAWPERPK